MELVKAKYRFFLSISIRKKEENEVFEINPILDNKFKIKLPNIGDEISSLNSDMQKVILLLNEYLDIISIDSSYRYFTFIFPVTVNDCYNKLDLSIECLTAVKKNPLFLKFDVREIV